jgi:hypothetical protein
MKFSFLAGTAVGYVLGARAGRERYENIVRLVRKVQGSQTAQATAGVLQAQAGDLRRRATGAVSAKLHGAQTTTTVTDPALNGHQPV